MSIYKNIDIELGLDLMTRARHQLRVGQLDFSDEQRYLKIATANGEYSQAIWEKIREIKKGQAISYERLAIISFAHTHNFHEHTGVKAHFSSTSIMFESKYADTDLIKGSLTLNTSETEDGQAGLSRFNLQNAQHREIAYTEETGDAFHKEAQRVMGRLMILREISVARQEIA